MEETLLGVYGADGWRGAAKERIKLQSELDRARDQVLSSQTPTPPPPPPARCCNPVVLSIVFCAGSTRLLKESFVVVFTVCLLLHCLSICLPSGGLSHDCVDQYIFFFSCRCFLAVPSL